MEKMESYGTVVARILLALLFVIMGLTKIASFSGIQGYMVASGIPGILLAPTILFGIGAEFGSDQVVAAHRLLDSDKAGGKIVVTVPN